MLAGIVGFTLAAEHDADTVRRGYRTGYVSRVGTARAARGRGIGTALVRYALDAYSLREVTVNEQNIAARGFYEHLGFRTVRRTPLDEQGRPYPLLYMELPEP